MRYATKYILVIFLYTLSASVVIGQQRSTESDTLSQQEKRSGIGTIFKGKPGKAALYSLIVPGAGQLYNKRWWKLPFVYALEGTALYYLVTTTRQFRQFNTCYESVALQNQLSFYPEIDNVACAGITTLGDAFTTRNITKQRQEYAWVFLIAAHVLQTLEAYIDRHLIDFDVDENLANLPNAIDPNQIKLFSLKIPLNKSPKAPKQIMLFDAAY